MVSVSPKRAGLRRSESSGPGGQLRAVAPTRRPRPRAAAPELQSITKASWDPAGFASVILRASLPCLGKEMVVHQMVQKEKEIRDDPAKLLSACSAA